MSKQKMTRNQLSVFFNGLCSVAKMVGVQFAYAVAKNKAHCEQEIKAMEEAGKPTEEYQEYEKERKELCEKHALKDEHGRPRVETLSPVVQRYVGLEENEKFQKELEKLNKKHQKVLDAREKQVKDYLKFCEEEIEIDVHQIALDVVPEKITVGQLEEIMPMIKE